MGVTLAIQLPFFFFGGGTLSTVHVDGRWIALGIHVLCISRGGQFLPFQQMFGGISLAITGLVFPWGDEGGTYIHLKPKNEYSQSVPPPLKPGSL